MGKMCEYFAYMLGKYTWLHPLKEAFHGDLGWEIAGYAPSGPCIAVRCMVEHPCVMARPFDESLNTFMAKHIQETHGKCITGHHWLVQMRDNLHMSSLPRSIPVRDLVVNKLTTAAADLAPLCASIDAQIGAAVADDAHLDQHDAVHQYRMRRGPTLELGMVQGASDMDMGEVNDDDEWYTAGDLTIPDVDAMDCV